MANTSTKNWTQKVQKQLNDQITAELEASFVYLAMAQHFDRNDVALKNIAKFFYKCSSEEQDHAKQFIEYQNKRSGTVVFKTLQMYNVPKDFTAALAFQKALDLEQEVYDKLLVLHDAGENDPAFQDLIASDYLHEQVTAINELKSYIAQLKRAGEGIGVFMFDKEFNS